MSKANLCSRGSVNQYENQPNYFILSQSLVFRPQALVYLVISIFIVKSFHDIVSKEGNRKSAIEDAEGNEGDSERDHEGDEAATGKWAETVEHNCWILIRKAQVCRKNL